MLPPTVITTTDSIRRQTNRDFNPNPKQTTAPLEIPSTGRKAIATSNLSTAPLKRTLSTGRAPNPQTADHQPVCPGPSTPVARYTGNLCFQRRARAAYRRNLLRSQECGKMKGPLQYIQNPSRWSPRGWISRRNLEARARRGRRGFFAPAGRMEGYRFGKQEGGNWR